MKNTRYPILFFTLVFTLFFSACSKEKSPGPDQANTKNCPLSEHITYSNSGDYTRSVYSYNADSTIQKITEFTKFNSAASESQFAYADFEYDTQKRVTEIKAFQLIDGTYKPVSALTTSFEYDDEGLLRTQTQMNGNSTFFLYDTNNHLKRIKYNREVIETDEGQYKKPGYTEVSCDEKGNVIEYRFYDDSNMNGISSLTQRVKYTYGELKNPLQVAYFYEFLDDPFAQLSVNNPLTLTRYVVNENGEEVLNNEDKYTYTYNTGGYATQRVSTNTNENPKIDYIYICGSK